MDLNTILAGWDFARSRSLAIADTIVKSGQDVQKVLAWRPGPGRAHMAWQFMHLAATHDRYINARLQNKPVWDEQLVQNFAGGSTPSDANVPSMDTIKQTLETTYTKTKAYLTTLTPADLQKSMDFGNVKRTVAESLILLGWHEGHHQGQIHLTWNIYKATHGIA